MEEGQHGGAVMKLSILVPNAQEPKINILLDNIDKLLPEAQVIICTDRMRQGKGWAVREALKEANGDIICFIDGDMDIHPRMILRLMPFLEDYDIVVGSKNIRRSFTRRMITRLSRVYLHLVFGFNFDTQTGIKLFYRYALPNWKSNGFMFDLEILRNARRKGMQIVSVPVEVADHGSTCKPMSLKNVLRCLIETIKIKKG